MDKIPEKFPSIYNHPQYKEINIRLYQNISYRAIADWLKEITECEDDCISPSRIGDYARYVKTHGDFKQLINPKDLVSKDITLSELDQHAINLMYSKLHKLEDGNFVQAFGMIMKYTRSDNINLNVDVDGKIEKKVTHNFLEKVKQNRADFNDFSSD